MRVRWLILTALVAGCAAPAAQRPAPAVDAASTSQLAAERPGLRRVGYRNCEGFAMQMLVPQDVGQTDPRHQNVWWEITPYQPDRHASYRIRVPEDFDTPEWRTERRAGTGWQMLERPQAAHPRLEALWTTLPAAQVGTSFAIARSVTDVTALGPEMLVPGTYRVQTAAFTVQVPNGQSCSMRPFWVFDIRQG